jgi:cytidine deaminase
LDNDLNKLFEHALEAKERAIAPYSKFRVGAAIRTVDGQIFAGCNIEVSSYGLTICAERVAIFKGLSEGAKKFRTLVVTSDSSDFCPPCGACRQVMSDFAPHMEIFLLKPDGEWQRTTVAALLPNAFGRDSLSAETGADG